MMTYELNWASEKDLDFDLTDDAEGTGNFNIERMKDGAIEIYARGHYYQDRDNYNTAESLTLRVEPEHAADFISTLQAWIEQL